MLWPGPKDRRRRAKAPGNAAMEMDAIAAANTAVFAMSVVACIAMLVAGMERGSRPSRSASLSRLLSGLPYACTP